jgi:hypothetical protein
MKQFQVKTVAPKTATQEESESKERVLRYGIDYVNDNDSAEVIDRFLKINGLEPYNY